ncbi:hypothetical protein AMTRI_Chr02g217400 [Amborella trichopoda]
MSSYNIIGFFLFIEYVTCISRLIFSGFPDHRGYQGTMYNTE